MLEQDAKFPNLGAVNAEVRGLMAGAMAKSGRAVDAEFLSPGASGVPSSTWQDPRFLQLMLARTEQAETAFDRYLLASSYTRESLDLELGLYLLLHDQFAAAKPWLASKGVATLELNADPFVTHIKDCFDCDFGSRRRDGKAWTLPALLERLNRLRVRANATGDAAARASLELGTALYNLTLMGNARSLALGTHQTSHDTSAALHWYRRAYTLARDRELKAQAAFLAAKAERGTLIEKQQATRSELAAELPVPVSWFSVVKRFGDTAYHRQVLAECGTYRSWLGKQQGG